MRRVERVHAQVTKSDDTILFIDELHTLVGAGAAEGAIDAANLLKPALARGELQCIGATTVTEYRRYIEKDAALERRFQPVTVPEPTVPETVDILTTLSKRYAAHHNVTYDAPALEAAAKLSERYLPDRFLPDKAIDLMDEAGAIVQIKNFDLNADGGAKKGGGFFGGGKGEVFPAVGEAEVAEVVSSWTGTWAPNERAGPPLDFAPAPLTLRSPPLFSLAHSRLWCCLELGLLPAGIPLSKLTADEAANMLGFEDSLHDRVIGQSGAVSAISRALRRARVGLRSPRRPVASMIFCGPTGVGKTELAKAVAELYYGQEKAMVRLDTPDHFASHSHPPHLLILTHCRLSFAHPPSHSHARTPRLSFTPPPAYSHALPPPLLHRCASTCLSTWRRTRYRDSPARRPATWATRREASSPRQCAARRTRSS